MPVDDRYRPDPRVLELGEGFFDPVEAARFPEHRLRFRNQPWAARVGLGDLSPGEWEGAFARFEPLPENLPEPLALRYHGHQFRNYNPYLGDGRGFLYAQLRDPEDGALLDLGTKGSGQTPYSRGGDGRLTLKGAVREVLATEMLEALGVGTSRTLSVFETGESLVRNDEPSPTRSAVLVRLGHGHLRIGSFQLHDFQGRADRLLELVDHARRLHFPELPGDLRPAEVPGAFLRAVGRRAARAVAAIEAAGFVHGVLNTDNWNVTGEVFDYGPYRFAPRWERGFVAAYFDTTGLYAFGRQVEAVRWNLARLARALALACPVLCDRGVLDRALEGFEDRVARARVEAVLRRLGVRPRDAAADAVLAEAWVAFLASSGVDLPGAFHDWVGGEVAADRALAGPRAGAYEGGDFAPVRRALEGTEPRGDLDRGDPALAAAEPCALLIDEIEAIWARIAREDDWGAFDEKVAAIRAYGRALGNGVATFRRAPPAG